MTENIGNGVKQHGLVAFIIRVGKVGACNTTGTGTIVVENRLSYLWSD